MVGPALEQSRAHHAIHEAAWFKEDIIQFQSAVEVFMEVGEASILAHVEDEEMGLHPEWLPYDGKWLVDVEKMIQDHARMHLATQTLERVYD